MVPQNIVTSLKEALTNEKIIKTFNRHPPRIFQMSKP